MTLATALTQFALARVLNWYQIERLLDLAKAETAQAVEMATDLAILDHAQSDPVHARQREQAYQLLLTAPYRRSTYYEARDFRTFEHKPEPDFSRPGDVIDVDPADVPDLPGLAAVR